MRTAEVYIWGELVGAVAWDENTAYAGFEYDPAFIRSGIELSPFMIPLSHRIFTFPGNTNETFKGLPGLLADSLPDKYGDQLIEEWLTRGGRNKNSLNPVERLCFIGKRGMGALEFKPVIGETSHKAEEIEINNLVETAQEILKKRTSLKTSLSDDNEQSLKEIIAVGTSAGGARSKAIIAYNEKTGEIRSGQANAPKGFEHWLIKLDCTHDLQLGNSSGWGNVEMAYYNMANDCGIDMMESRLFEENGRAHFMTKRFDREGSSTKHHIQTFCAIRHYDFSQIGAYSYEQLFQTLRELHLPYSAAEQMFRRMTFNIMARNCDDHTKNFAFRLKKGQEWDLAPAYDMCYSFNPANVWVSQQSLSVNGKRKDISKDDIIRIANQMNIKKPLEIIDRISEVVSSWQAYAGDVNVRNEKQISIEKELTIL